MNVCAPAPPAWRTANCRRSRGVSRWEKKSVVFSGDTNGEGHLAKLAAGADLLVAHNAVPETAQGTERSLHMPPSTIGRIAKNANVKQLVLSHRMQRTVGRESEALEQIRRHYTGPAVFANDLDCFTP